MREAMLILHFIGLTMGLGTGFAHAFLGASAEKMTPDEATKFQLKTLVLSRMGHIGLTLLLISGFYLITPYWKILPVTPLLITKLVLVAILILLIGMMSVTAAKAKKADPGIHFKKIKILGTVALVVGVAIVIVAVSMFH